MIFSGICAKCCIKFIIVPILQVFCVIVTYSYSQSKVLLKETTMLVVGNHGAGFEIPKGKIMGSSSTLIDKLYKLDCELSLELHFWREPDSGKL